MTMGITSCTTYSREHKLSYRNSIMGKQTNRWTTIHRTDCSINFCYHCRFSYLCTWQYLCDVCPQWYHTNS